MWIRLWIEINFNPGKMIFRQVWILTEKEPLNWENIGSEALRERRRADRI